MTPSGDWRAKDEKKGLFAARSGIPAADRFALFAFAPGLFTGYGQKELFTKWLPVGRGHLLGTNAMGYDIFTELIYGARQTLLVGVLSSILTLILGAGIGILGSFRGWVGQIFNGLIQIFLFCFRSSSRSSYWQRFFRQLRRASDRSDRGVQLGRHGTRGACKGFCSCTQPFIESCRILGYSRAHIAVRHILPNLSDVLLSRFLLGVNSCIMMESTLSFLGLGDLYRPTWGHDGQFCV